MAVKASQPSARRPGRRSIPSDKAAARAVLTLLGQMAKHIGVRSIEEEDIVDIDVLPPKARKTFLVILDHIQAHPGLMTSFDDRHRDFLLRMMATSTAQLNRHLVPRHVEQIHGVDWGVEASIFPRAIRLLGGPRLLKHEPSSQAEIHAAIVEGIPYSVLCFLATNTMRLTEEDVASVVGVSTRTLRRQKDTPQRLMPHDLGSKTWLFAETLAKAEDVFGTKEEAERWMAEKAMGLDGARPIDLLRTVQGANLVSQFLERLKYGVYN